MVVSTLQFGLGSVSEASRSVWCGSIDKDTNNWFGTVLVRVLNH